MPRSSAPPWLAYIGVFLAVMGFAGGLANQWFSLRERVKVLEDEQRYLHGTFTVPPEGR